ncbi:MAG: hypothetical protein RMK30_00915, partial [Anaerolineae bacterium]|nr:hypothetical protein [Anaerolineae bacterium]
LLTAHITPGASWNDWDERSALRANGGPLPTYTPLGVSRDERSALRQRQTPPNPYADEHELR